jgi:hypothetical protein
MDDIKSTTARLRRTFHYPGDDDDDSADSQPEAMDEEGKVTPRHTSSQFSGTDLDHYKFATLTSPEPQSKNS